jgi:hypothetical protein
VLKKHVPAIVLARSPSPPASHPRLSLKESSPTLFWPTSWS